MIWDEFTHPGRFGTRHLAWLAERHGPLEGYRWAQYASGVIGGLVLLAAVLRWYRTTPAGEVPPVARRRAATAWSTVFVAALIGGLTGAVRAWDDGVRRVLFAGATWGGGTALAVAVLVAAALQRQSRASTATIAD